MGALPILSVEALQVPLSELVPVVCGSPDPGRLCSVSVLQSQVISLPPSPSPTRVTRYYPCRKSYSVRDQGVEGHRREKVVSKERSKFREHATVVAINEAGDMIPPRWFSRGNQGSWRELTAGVYRVPCTLQLVHPSCRDGCVYATSRHLASTLLIPGKLMGSCPCWCSVHTPQTFYRRGDKFGNVALSLLSQRPSHSSQNTPSLGVAAFGIFKREKKSVLQSFPRRNGEKAPVRST